MILTWADTLLAQHVWNKTSESNVNCYPVFLSGNMGERTKYPNKGSGILDHHLLSVKKQLLHTTLRYQKQLLAGYG